MRCHARADVRRRVVLNVIEGLTDGRIVALFGIYQASDY